MKFTVETQRFSIFTNILKKRFNFLEQWSEQMVFVFPFYFHHHKVKMILKLSEGISGD